MNKDIQIPGDNICRGKYTSRKKITYHTYWEDPFLDVVHKYEAQVRWRNGEKPSFSSNIGDELTCGYGVLDGFGYFEFPLEPAEDYLPKD